MNQQFDPLYQFRWPIPDAGFDVVDGPPDAADKLVEKVAALPWTGATSATPKLRSRRKSKPQPVRLLMLREWERRAVAISSPLVSETGLFRTFASLHPASESKVLAFANEHGSLFERYADWPVGEYVSAWFQEIAAMHHLMKLWDYIDQRLDALSAVIAWDQNRKEVTYRGELVPTPIVLASDYDIRHPDAVSASMFAPGDLVGPARFFFKREMNRQLDRYPVVSQLLFKDSRHEDFLLCDVPSSLISALWLQFSRSVQEKKTHRQCEQCGRWFEVMPEKLEGGKFCRNACRTKAYRERIEQARKLRAAGMSVKKISEKLNSDEKTVKGWVKK